MAAPTMEPMDCGAGDRAATGSGAAPQAPFALAQPHDSAGISPQFNMMPHAVFVPGQAAVAPPQPENQYCTLKNIAVEKKIGHGQFSVVYRARCKLNGAVVALKKVQVVQCVRKIRGCAVLV